MPIETPCPGCGSKLRVADEHAGRQARCPKCQTVYQVPAAAAAPSQAESSRPAAGGWFLMTGGQDYGPVSKAEIDRWVAEGRVSSTSKIRQDDRPWQDAAHVYPQLATGAMGGGAMGARAIGGGAFPAEQSPFQQNPFADRDARVNPYASASSIAGGVRGRRPHRGGLVLAFGILGFVICAFFGIASWIMGRNDLQEMRAGRMDPSGMGMTQAGMILGIIQCCLMGIWALVMVVFIASAIVAH